MSFGDKVINYISGIRKDIPRRCLAVLGFIVMGILAIAAVVFEIFYKSIMAILEEIVLYSREIFPRIKSFFSDYMRLW